MDKEKEHIAKQLKETLGFEKGVMISKERYDQLLFIEKLVNSPEINDFLKGVQLEAVHQVQRWGIENEEASPPHHFILVFAKLLGKMSTDVFDRDVEKFKHHCIAVAAEMHNIHRQIDKEGTEINKWFHK